MSETARENLNTPMSARRCLAERMHDEDLEPQSNVVEVHGAQLRRKLDPDDELNPNETVRGGGYLFTVPRKSWPTDK